MNILISIPAIVWLLISALFFAAGEFLSKIWGQNPSIRLTILVVLVYSLGAITWLPALLHKNQLSVMGMLWLLLGVIATVLIGVFIFHEHLNNYQIIGIVLAILAMILINIQNI